MRNCVFNRRTKTLPSPICRFGRAHHYGDGFFHHVVCEHDFNFHLGQKINGVFASAINFGCPFCRPKLLLPSLSCPRCRARQGLFHFLEFEGLDDRFEFFIAVSLRARALCKPKADRGTRSLSNATRAMQLRFCENKRMSFRGRGAADADWDAGERAMRRVDRAVSCSMLIQAARPHFFNIARRSGRSTSALREPHEKSRRYARQICQKFCPLNTDVVPRDSFVHFISTRILPSRWRGSDARADE